MHFDLLLYDSKITELYAKKNGCIFLHLTFHWTYFAIWPVHWILFYCMTYSGKIAYVLSIKDP